VKEYVPLPACKVGEANASTDAELVVGQAVVP
jgi:hypothetical protein